MIEYHTIIYLIQIQDHKISFESFFLHLFSARAGKFAYSGLNGLPNTIQSIEYLVLNDKIPRYNYKWDIKGNPYGDPNISLIVLEHPVIFENGLNPIKVAVLHPNVLEIATVHVGISVQTGSLHHSNQKIYQWPACVTKYSQFNNLEPLRFFESQRSALCSNVLNFEDFIVQGPYILKGATPIDDQLIGIHTFDFHLPNKSHIAIISKIAGRPNLMEL